MTSLGRIVTVCKGVNRADSVSFVPGVKLILVPEPTCEFDKNAVKVCIERKNVSTSNTSSSGNNSNSSSSSSAAESSDKLFFCGYLPKVLVNHLAAFISDQKNFVVVALALDEKDDESLMLKHQVDNAFDLSLDFFAAPVPSSAPVGIDGEEAQRILRILRVEQLKKVIASINSHHQNRI